MDQWRMLFTLSSSEGQLAGVGNRKVKTPQAKACATKTQNQVTIVG